MKRVKILLVASLVIGKVESLLELGQLAPFQRESTAVISSAGPWSMVHPYMQKTCDVAGKAILAKKNCGKSA